jgi:N-ethylmaleimide reductase
MNKLLEPFKKNGFELKNHLVMAPMTRSRAIDNIPNQLMADYYGQRTGAGLIITEGTAPMADGLGYARIPGIFSQAQVEGWKNITEAVHKGGSKFFVQLMHTGRIAHQDNMPENGKILAPSAVKAAGNMFTDTKGLQGFSKPGVFTIDDIKRTIEGHVTAAMNAMKAGFDGIEIHGANGYLTEQFLNPNVNKRTDAYGGSMENRSRFVIETVQAIAQVIGRDKIGVRISPYSTINDQPVYDPEEVYRTYAYLAEQFSKAEFLYIHLSTNPNASQNTYQAIREKYKGIIIQCNGLTPESALKALDGYADLVAFARNWLANPDLDKRIAKGAGLNKPKPELFYTPGAKGYTDYPTLIEQYALQ